MLPNFILRNNWIFMILTLITLGAAEALQGGYESGYGWGCNPQMPRPTRGIWMGHMFELGFRFGVASATFDVNKAS